MKTHYGDDVTNGWVNGGYYIEDLPGASPEKTYKEHIEKLNVGNFNDSMRVRADAIRKKYDIKVSIPLGPEMAQHGR
jgi:hypothetical protein